MTAHFLSLVTILLLVVVIKIEGNSLPNELVQKQQLPTGCTTAPWTCNPQREVPPRSACCRDRCVNLNNDPTNCGLCGVTCPFNWQCCNRLCVDINVSILNCGRCGNACPVGRPCILGNCGNLSPPPTTDVPPLSPLPPPSVIPPVQSLPPIPPVQPPSSPAQAPSVMK